MGRRLKFTIAQPITIVGFLLSTTLLLAGIIAMTVSHTYQLPATSPAAPAEYHSLTSAFYYAIMAVVVYSILVVLMCWTVWGVVRGHFGRQFNLTAAQRTLMLQTMAFVIYLLVGALCFSHIEGWRYLDAVYFADVTLLTVGLGDFSPSTHTGRSLLIPFAIGGIVIIGLVIGSIRTLILERGREKISARMMEKKRLRAINSVDTKKHRIKVSHFKSIPFNDTFTNAAQKREQEFRVMRSVQDCAERDRRWMALGVSLTAGFLLWFIGALVFWFAERKGQGWTYFEALYFSYVCLLTIGYGSPSPVSNSGKAFFVFWSLLAVPALTILISDMGDTVVQVFSNLTIWLGSLTVLPNESGFRATGKTALKQFSIGRLDPSQFETQKPPGFIPASENHKGHENYCPQEPEHETIQDKIADRLATHLEAEELRDASEAQDHGDELDRDLHFYHFVLARECQRLLKDLNQSPPKRYQWGEWEYFIRLMANNYDAKSLNGQLLVPESLRIPETKEQWKEKRDHHYWSWLSEHSPLMNHQSETEWLLERISGCLEKQLKDMRLSPNRRTERARPPISMAEMLRRGRIKVPRKEDASTEDLTRRSPRQDSDPEDSTGDLKREIDNEKDVAG